MKESSRDGWRGWHRRSVTASAPRFCTSTVTVRGSPATTGKRMCPLPWSCSETISTPCFPQTNSALREGAVRLSLPGPGSPGLCRGRRGQGAAGRTTSWHGPAALADGSWAAGLRQTRTPTPLRSFWVSSTGLPSPRASSPARSPQRQRGPRVQPGAPRAPVPVGAGAAALPQPGPPHLLEVHRLPVHLGPVGDPQRVQDAGEAGHFCVSPAQTRRGFYPGLPGAQAAEQRRARRDGARGTP